MAERPAYRDLESLLVEIERNRVQMQIEQHKARTLHAAVASSRETPKEIEIGKISH
jgi:hypothetical protein